MTKEQLYMHFGNTPEEHLKPYNPHGNKFWKISIYDLPEILRKFGMKPYQKLRLIFLNHMDDCMDSQKVDLEDFVAVSYLGMMLIDLIDEIDYYHTSFYIPLKKFYRYIYQIKESEFSQIRSIATSHFGNYRNGYSDYFLYDADHHEKCILIEFAINEEMQTIIGQIDRLINKFSQRVVMLERIPGTPLQSEEKSYPIRFPIPVKNKWFLYFDENEKKLAQIEELVKETKEYCQVNMMFCHCDLNKYEETQFRVKLHNDETFTDYPSF